MAKNKFEEWPQGADNLAIDKVIEMYTNGFIGAKSDPENMERFRASLEQPIGEDIATAQDFADSGAGKLIVPFVHVLEMFPGCWPGRQGQGRGDCVSWSTRNATLGTMVCDIVSALPDEVTGKPEEKPEVSTEGIADGVLSTESFYWYRGYDGDGWQCPDAADVATKTSGAMVRKNYTELDVDLTSYSSRMAGKYGSRKPPENIRQVGALHRVHKATMVSSFEALRDFLNNGFFASTCGGEGLSDRRDDNGVSKRSGSWAHAMAYIGADDRDVVKQVYGEPLVLDLNSWAKWNSGPRDILQSAAMVPSHKKDEWVQKGIVNAATGNIMIPEGSCWVKYSEMRRREMIIFSGINGWPKKNVDPLVWA